MLGNRGVDTDPGWINRQLQELQKAVEEMRSERRTGSVTIASGGTLKVASGGKVKVESGGSLELILPTTSATANVNVDPVTGVLARSTSSRRYKQDIADIDLDPVAILKMRPRVWHDKNDVAEDGAKAPWYVGFVAEELHDAGLGVFVGYDPAGQPETVDYDRLTVALLIAVKWLAGQLKAQRDRVGALERAVTDLTARMEALEPKAEPTPPPATPNA